MLQITPAILTTDKTKLELLLKRYVKVGFSSIDIDVQAEPFVSDDTLDFNEVLDILSNSGFPDNVSIGLDLKIKQPKSAVDEVVELSKRVETSFRIYVYSTAEIQFLEDYDVEGNHLGLGILGSAPLKGRQFLDRFDEVQLMTIRAERQGSKLDPNLLDRVNELQFMGYEGQVSLDGGVNLKSAELINAYAKEVRIDRVSVGSYFQKSKDLELDKQKLELALNI